MRSAGGTPSAGVAAGPPRARHRTREGHLVAPVPECILVLPGVPRSANTVTAGAENSSHARASQELQRAKSLEATPPSRGPRAKEAYGLVFGVISLKHPCAQKPFTPVLLVCLPEIS